MGTVFIVAGALLLTLGAVRLGHNLTPFPRPKKTGTLVTTGLYGLVRHPMYGGIVLLACATALRASTCLVMPLPLFVFLFFEAKANREEQWLMQKFGGYRDYCRYTAKLVPWLY